MKKYLVAKILDPWFPDQVLSGAAGCFVMNIADF